MTAIHFSKSIIKTSLPTSWSRKALLGTESPLDIAMDLARDDKPGRTRTVQLTPKQTRKLEAWKNARALR